MLTPIEAARLAFGPDVTILDDEVRGIDAQYREYDVGVTFDPSIHLDDDDTYVGSVYADDMGVWFAMDRTTAFVPSFTDEPPADFDGQCGDPYPITLG